jgi:transposase InsO family protein
MPWKAVTMSESRTAFVSLIHSAGCSFTEACRRFGISRKTGYKWLARHRAAPEEPLRDHSRRPHGSPFCTPPEIERQILAIRDRYGWGGRKIQAFLRTQGLHLPSARTVANVLRRCGRIRTAPSPSTASQRFERAVPNELWQVDFKGPVEVARRRLPILTALDDHSRYLLALEVCPDQTMATAWNILWNLFAEVGLPDAILCDGGFAARGPGSGRVGLSWFDAHLVRLDIHPWHGRPYHPQTQGKAERLHGTLEAELWPRLRRDDEAAFRKGLRHWRTQVYNCLRPHEALGDVPPVRRWHPSLRPRPAKLPAIQYPQGAILRKVMQRGEISWRNQEILVGAGLAGECVRLTETEHDLVICYSWKEVRRLPLNLRQPGAIL